LRLNPQVCVLVFFVLTFLFLNVFVVIVFVTESTHFHFCVNDSIHELKKQISL
jgi:hypothetical protein